MLFDWLSKKTSEMKASGRKSEAFLWAQSGNYKSQFEKGGKSIRLSKGRNEVLS